MNKINPITEPLTAADMDSAGWVKGIIRVDLSEAIDNDLEGFLDILSERLTDSPLLMDISWRVVGHKNNTLFLEVKGDASEVFTNKEDES